MKLIIRSMLVSMLMIITTPSYSGVATQMWRCEMDDDVSEEDVIAMAEKWLKAAKQVEGGQDLELQVMFPVAVNSTGEIDVLLLLTAPSFTDWGKFWDGYTDSEAAQLDKDDDDKLVCPDSVLWESQKID